MDPLDWTLERHEPGTALATADLREVLAAGVATVRDAGSTTGLGLADRTGERRWRPGAPRGLSTASRRAVPAGFDAARGPVRTLKALGREPAGRSMDRQQILALILTFLMVGSSVAYAIAVL